MPSRYIIISSLKSPHREERNPVSGFHPWVRRDVSSDSQVQSTRLKIRSANVAMVGSPKCSREERIPVSVFHPWVRRDVSSDSQVQSTRLKIRSANVAMVGS